MSFSNSITSNQPLPNLTILNDNGLQVDKIKFLGVTIGRNLTFKHHISNLCLKLSSHSPSSRSKTFCPVKILKCLYYAHIYSHLTYSNSISSQTNLCHLSQINVLHKKVITVITNNDFNDHTQPLFKVLNILNLADLSNHIASYM